MEGAAVSKKPRTIWKVKQKSNIVGTGRRPVFLVVEVNAPGTVPPGYTDLAREILATLLGDTK